MSDTLSIPYAPGTPEYDEYVRGSMRGFAIPATNLPVGALSTVLPDPKATGVQGYIPGAVSGAYSAIDTVGALAQQYIGGRKPEDIAHLPGGERAGELASGSMDSAASLLPHMEPQTPSEQVVADAARAGGTMVVPLPGAVARALPAPVAGLARGLLPGSPSAALVAAGLTGGVEAAMMPSSAEAAPSQSGVIDLSEPARPASSRSNVIDLSTPTPPSPLPTTAPSSVLDLSKPTDFIDLSEPKASTDDSDWTFGTAAKYVAGAVALLAAAPFMRRGVAALEGAMRDRTPAPGADLSARMRGAVVDQDAVVKDVLKEMSVNPSTGERLAAEYGDTIGSQPTAQRYQAGAESGDFYGVKMPTPIIKFFQQVAKAPEDVRQRFSQTMHYGNELDNRLANQRTWVGNTAPTDADLAVNFAGQRGEQFISTADLKSYVQQQLADPQIKSLVDISKQHSDAFVDVLVAKNMMTAAEAARLKAAHNYYVPSSDLEGIIKNPLTSRNLEAGAGSHEMPAVWDLMDQHHYALYSAIERNDGIGSVIKTIEDYQQRNPQAPKVAYRNTTVPSDGSGIQIRRNGQLESWHIVDDNLRAALKGSPVQHNTYLSALNKARGIMQGGYTGATALLGGTLFNVVTATRDVGLIAASRPKGMYGTPLEKLTRGLVQADPISPYVGAAYRMGADLTAESARGLAKFFDPANPGSIAQRVNLLMGPKASQAISDRLQHVYATSVRGVMREQGALGGAGWSAKVVDDAGGIRTPVHMPSMDHVPELFRMNSMTGTTTYVKLRNLFNEVRSIIGEAPHTQFYALNADNSRLSQRQLNYEVRQITGDPGTRGNSGFAKWYGAAVPYGNVSIQGLARVARAFNEAPIGFTARFMSHYGTLVAASLYTLSMAGPDAIKHYFDELTDDQRSKEIHLAIPGGDPRKPVRIPIPAEMRVPINVMMQAGYDLMQLTHHQDNPDIAEHVQNVLSQFFQQHIWHSTVDGAVAAASAALPPANTVGTTLLGAAVGKNIDISLKNAYQNADRPFSEWFSYDLNGKRHVPGQNSKIDPVTGSVNGSVYQQLLSDVLGTGGIALHDLYKDWSHPRGGTAVAFNNFMDAWARRFTESFTGGNQLWSVGDKAVRSTPLQSRVEDSLAVMRPTATFKSDEKYAGLTRKGGQQIMEQATAQSAVPSDPLMRQLYQTTGTFMNLINGNKFSPIKELNDLKTQVASLRNSPLPPEQLRAMRNGLEQRIQVKYQSLQDQIHSLNTQLSNIVGHQVDVRNIDFSKGPEQFQ